MFVGNMASFVLSITGPLFFPNSTRDGAQGLHLLGKFSTNGLAASLVLVLISETGSH